MPAKRSTTSPKSRPKPPTALAAHRQRLRSRGLQRLEVQVLGEDAPLVRAVAAALADPQQAPEARVLLRRLVPGPVQSLKALLASAPFDEIELNRSRDTGRAVDL
jgi:hypothetical protein